MSRQKMKAVIIGVQLLCAAAFAVADGGVPDMPEEFRADAAEVVAAAARATPVRYPDADYVYLANHIHTHYEADGADITWFDEWVKPVTQKGRRICMPIVLRYNERYGDAGIVCVEVAGTNGAVRTVDFAKTLKVSTDNASLNSNIVDPLKKKLTCSVPEISDGEIRHVRFWRRTRRAYMKGTWFDVNGLEFSQPIVSASVSVEGPKELPLAHAVVRNAFSNTVTRLPDVALPNGFVRYAWHARDVPQLFHEPAMPAISRCAQTLRLSTIANWATVSRWYWNLCVPHIAKTTPAMTNEVARLTKDCSGDDAKVRALFKFVSQQVRYMGLTLEDTSPGFEPHDVSITFENRYGVCRDKAALLVAMLRIAGVEAYPVLIHAGDKKDPGVPTVSFNHAIVGVKSPNGTWQLMDPTDESAKDLMPAYLSDKSYLAATPRGETLRTSPVATADENKLTVNSEGSLNADGDALLTTTFVFNGINDNMMRKALIKKMPRARRAWFENVWRRVFSGAELLSADIQPADLQNTDERLVVKTVVRLPGLVLRGKTRDAVTLPFATENTGVVNSLLSDNTLLESRRFPLVLMCTASAEETLKLTLGDAVGALQALPKSVHERAGQFEFTRDAACSNGVLTAWRVMRLNGHEFDPAAYDALRTARTGVESAARDHVLFAVRKEDENKAHLRLHKDVRVICYSSPTAWVVTNEVRREVLTTRGRKMAGELKFSSVPSVGSVELVRATVAGRDGKVQPVTSKEINVLDGAWTTEGANRYPVSKLLVANLPGVEVGSVIDYTVVHTVTNSPVADSMFYPFGGSSATDFEQVEIHVPHGMEFHHSHQRLPKGAFHAVTNERESVYFWTMCNIPRVSEEASQPSAGRWRPYIATSCADWKEYGSSLVGALAKVRDGEFAQTLDGKTPEEKIASARKLLCKVRMTGPGLFDVPFDKAFTPVSRVWREGYGSRTDRMNLLYSMLEGAGFDCSFVLAASDAKGFRGNEKGWRAMPRPPVFGTLLVKAVWREGHLPFMRDEKVFWLSTENEYTPPEASSRIGDSYYDPQTDCFGRVDVPAAKWHVRHDFFAHIEVRENGAADFAITNRTYGAEVGVRRKTWAELLPEMRNRAHQDLLGSLIAQNAAATSELTIDTENYPFSLSFDAYAEKYAVVSGNAITLKLSDFGGRVFAVGGERRQSPVYLGATDEENSVYEIVFPEGYTRIEAMPQGFEIINPLNPKDVWLRHEVSYVVKNGRLTVTIRRCNRRNTVTQLTSVYQSFLLEWNRRAAAEAVRTISVRRP